MFGIEESFSSEQIEESDADFNNEEEEEFNKWFPELIRMAGVAPSETEDGIYFAVPPSTMSELVKLAFVAGRTYQAQFKPEITVPMSHDMAVSFMQFLAGE